MSAHVESLAPPRGLIFDIDGVLLNTKEFIFGAFEHVLAAHGVAGVTREHISAIMGKPAEAMYDILAVGCDAAALAKEHEAHHAAHLDLITSYDGALEVLDDAQQRELRLGVFTGFHQGTYARLRDFGMLDYFSSIVEATRYKKHKPDPEGLELGMRELRVTPEQTVFVGDGITDMEAGVRAGVPRLVGVTHGFCTRTQLEDHGATHIIDSLRELPDLMSSFGVSQYND